MNTLTKLVLGKMGRLRPVPTLGDALERIALPPPRRTGGMPLMEALDRRSSAREFSPDPLELVVLGDLLWAANGVNREGAGRTAPSGPGASISAVMSSICLPARSRAARTQKSPVAGTGPSRSTSTRLSRVSSRCSHRSSARTSRADGGAPCWMSAVQVLRTMSVARNRSPVASTSISS